MTSIQQLQITGIRSFDPNPSHKQTIYFQKPLTVILGKNGAGKTTIIEALLNACAGIMPPGSGQEKSSFVYDPKVIGEAEVKAQIRLIFTGKEGKMIQVIRSFQVTRIRQKVTFNTLDNTVAYQDTATGKVLSSTYKASQVDRVVPEMLGVSPAVLEHVIFCHQEASNWPLSSPKEVKQIFDEIFSATRYVLALERFREIGKEYRQQLKEQEGTMMALREHREQAQLLLQTIQRKEVMIKEIGQRATDVQPRVQELQAVLTALDGVEKEVEDLTLEAAVLGGKAQEKRAALLRMNGVEKRHACSASLDQLHAELAQQKKLLEEAQSQRANALPQAQNLEKEMKQVEGELRQLDFSLQHLEREEFEHQQHCSHLRAQIGASNAQKLFSADFVVEADKAQVMVRSAQTAVRDTQQEMQAQLHKVEERISAQELQRQTVLRRMDADAKECEMLTEILQELKRRAQSTQDALQPLTASTSPQLVAEHRAAVSRGEEQVKLVRHEQQQGSHARDVAAVQQTLEVHSEKTTALRQQLARLRSSAAAEKETQTLKEQLRHRETQLEREMEDSFVPRLRALKIPGPHTPSNLRVLVSTVEDCLEKHKADHDGTMKELTEIQHGIRLTKELHAQRAEEMAQREAELAAVQHDIVSRLKADAGKDVVTQYEEQCEEAARRVEVLEQELHKLRALSLCFADLLEDAATVGACPLCERPLDEHVTLEGLVALNEKWKPSPQLVAETETNIVEASKLLESLRGIRPKVESARQLQFQLHQLKEHMNEEGREPLASELAKLDMLHERCHQQKTTLEVAQEAVHIAKNLEKAQQEIFMLVSSLATKHSPEHATDVDSSPTLEEVMDAYEAATAEQQELHAKLSLLQAASGPHDALRQAEEELQAKKTSLYRCEVDLQRRCALEEALKQVHDEMNERKSKHQDIVQERLQLQSSLSQMEKAVEVLQQERATIEANWKARFIAAQQYASTLESAVQRALHFSRPEGFGRLTRERENRGRLKVVLQRIHSEETALQQRIEEYNRAVQEGQEKVREIQELLEIRRHEAELHSEEARLAEIQTKLVALKGSQLENVEDLLGPDAAQASLSRLRELIRDKMRVLEKTQAQQAGNAEMLLEDVNQLKGDLAGEKYLDVERRYRFTFLQVQTTRMAIKDIDKYYVALEKAVQSYHQEKIALINRIIADLWRQTYRGSDIDAVEIRSETESTSMATGRRSYNYRVVMKRGSSEIDMRGRCSAGQKVLASIIIRLALSEVFCYDCGILALDEPTTNLDEDNARSLAEALRVLIESRRSVRHFQLIVITHDEQFVRALGGQGLDRFYFVHKDREGSFSIIEERMFDQLFA